MSANPQKIDYSHSTKSLTGQASIHEPILAGVGRVFVKGEYPKALRCDGAGVLEFKDANGTVGTYNVLQAETFPFENITEVTTNTDIIVHAWW